jgi:hypothetical protein
LEKWEHLGKGARAMNPKLYLIKYRDKSPGWQNKQTIGKEKNYNATYMIYIQGWIQCGGTGLEPPLPMHPIETSWSLPTIFSRRRERRKGGGKRKREEEKISLPPYFKFLHPPMYTSI